MNLRPKLLNYSNLHSNLQNTIPTTFMLITTRRWSKITMKVAGAVTLKMITKMQSKMMMTQAGKYVEEPIV